MTQADNDNDTGVTKIRVLNADDDDDVVAERISRADGVTNMTSRADGDDADVYDDADVIAEQGEDIANMTSRDADVTKRR